MTVAMAGYEPMPCRDLSFFQTVYICLVILVYHCFCTIAGFSYTWLQFSIQQQTLLVVNGSGHVLLFKLAIQPGSGRPADGKVCVLSVCVCVCY